MILSFPAALALRQQRNLPLGRVLVPLAAHV
jgi:hypothetical protein